MTDKQNPHPVPNGARELGQIAPRANETAIRGFSLDERLILWDRNWRPFWDSASATRGAYELVNGWCHATIDASDGTRWVGQMYRCAEGVRRFSFADRERMQYLTQWPNPLVATTSRPANRFGYVRADEVDW